MSQQGFNVTRAALIVVLSALCLWPIPRSFPVLAADAVVSAPWGEAQFNAVLAAVQGSGGGTLTFDCGGAQMILFQSAKTITTLVVIEGQGNVTLTGGNSTRLFVVNGGVVYSRFFGSTSTSKW